MPPTLWLLWYGLLAAVVGARAQVAMMRTTVSPPRVTIGAIALAIRSRAIQDSRCYLMNGGAVESFFISEDTAVGAVVGTLSVNGDAREAEGNIVLTLQEKEAAVGIVRGTKNVTLLRPLDREEIIGPSNVYVNVRCDRRRTNDPSFIIPVSVRVWDVNDNAPVWSAPSYTARLSELTAPGSRIIHALRATDADQPTHHTIHYSVMDGPYSEYFKFVNELDSSLVLQKSLDHETLPNFTVTLRATDQGTPPLHADAHLHVLVLDADDLNPKFQYDSYTALIPDDAKEGDELTTSPSAVSAFDQDVSIAAPLYYSVSESAITVDKDTGKVFASKELLVGNVMLPLTVVMKATQYDNADRYALCTLQLRRTRTLTAVTFTQKAFAASTREDTPPGTLLLTLTTNRIHDKSGLQFFVSERSFLDKFAINSAGELVLRRPLDYETQDQYYYQVMVTDGLYNDTASLNVTVTNVNDWEPRFRYPQYEFRVEPPPDAAGLVPVGKVDAFDGDKGDHVALSVSGPDASMFYLNDAGELFLRAEALKARNGDTLALAAIATDEGTPPRRTSVPVLVHVPMAASTPALLPAILLGTGLLAVAMLTLLALCWRKRGKSPPPKSPPLACPGPLKSPSPPAPAPPQKPPAEAGGSLQSVSAGASTILANSSSSLDLRGTLPHKCGGGSRVAPQLLSDHVSAGSNAVGRSGVAWPANTIPARVKKLSWDDAGDAQHNGEHSAEITDATNPTLADHMNLTVYF